MQGTSEKKAIHYLTMCQLYKNTYFCLHNCKACLVPMVTIMLQVWNKYDNEIKPIKTLKTHWSKLISVLTLGWCDWGRMHASSKTKKIWWRGNEQNKQNPIPFKDDDLKMFHGEFVGEVLQGERKLQGQMCGRVWIQRREDPREELMHRSFLNSTVLVKYRAMSH